MVQGARKPQTRPVPTPEVRAAAGVAVRQIAGMCDGARKIDGCGFNKLDTRIGRDLAQRSVSRPLTDGETALACALATRYRGQIGGEEAVKDLTEFAKLAGMFRPWAQRAAQAA